MNEYDNDDYETETDLYYGPYEQGPYEDDESSDGRMGALNDQLFDMMMEDRIGGTGVEDFGGE